MTNRLTPPPVGAPHDSTQFQTWYSLINNYFNQLSTDFTHDATPQSLQDLGLITEVWSYRLAGKEEIFSSPIGPIPVHDAGNVLHQAVIFVGYDWYIYAVDISTGALIWRTATGAPCYGRCQAADVNADGKHEIFAASHDGYIWSLTDKGVLRWTFPNLYTREGAGTTTASTATTLTDAVQNWGPNAFLRAAGVGYGASIQYTTGPAAGQIREITANPGGTVLTVGTAFAPVPTPGGGDNYIIIPKYTSDTYFQHAGTLVDEAGTKYLYIGGFDNHIYKINANTGVLVWKYATLENIEPYPLVVSVAGNLRCIVSSLDGYVYSLNAATGALVWSTYVGPSDAFLHAADVDNDGVLEIIVPTTLGRIQTLNAITGAIKNVSTSTGSWQFPALDCAAVPYLLQEETTPRIYTGGDSGTGWCFDNNLNVKWNKNLVPNVINMSPQIHDILGTGDFYVLFGDARGTLHVMNSRTGLYLGCLYVKGGYEGIPYYGSPYGDGKTYIIVPTLDGYLTCFRFTYGSVYTSPYYPGNTIYSGSQ